MNCTTPQFLNAKNCILFAFYILVFSTETFEGGCSGGEVTSVHSLCCDADLVLLL